MKSPLSQFDIVCFMPLFLNEYDISITNLSLTALLVVFLGYLIFYLCFNDHIVPRNFQIVLESIFLFIYRLVIQQIGIEGIIYFPLILTLFTFILMLNLFSLLPFGFAVTSHLIWTLYFSISICVGIFVLGYVIHGVKFLKLFVPQVPLLLYPMMIILELLSYIIRSFSLAIRLSANIIAGHTLVHIISELIMVLSSVRGIIIFIPFVLLIAILILELGIAVLQAYIFTILTCMYLHDSIHMLEH